MSCSNNKPKKQHRVQQFDFLSAQATTKGFDSIAYSERKPAASQEIDNVIFLFAKQAQKSVLTMCLPSVRKEGTRNVKSLSGGLNVHISQIVGKNVAKAMTARKLPLGRKVIPQNRAF